MATKKLTKAQRAKKLAQAAADRDRLLERRQALVAEAHTVDGHHKQKLVDIAAELEILERRIATEGD